MIRPIHRIHRRRPRAAGMTLLELLIAIALLALITTMSYRGIDSLTRSSDRLLGDSERWQGLALFFARFGNDVTQPVARPIRIGPLQAGTAAAPPPANLPPPPLPLVKPPGLAGLAATAFAGVQARQGATPYAQTQSTPNAPTLAAWYGQDLPALAADDSGYAAQLEFTRKSPTGRDEVRIGYRLRGTRLELLLWPVLDRAPDSRPQIYTVLEGVAALRLRHLDDAGVWQENWPPEGSANETLPRGVEIEITLQDGTRLRRVFALPS